MSPYMFVESRDPFESRSFAMRCELAASLAREGAAVTVFLVENAVFAARDRAPIAELAMLKKSGATVMADALALRERGIDAHDISIHVQSTGLDALVARLADGAKALWS